MIYFRTLLIIVTHIIVILFLIITLQQLNSKLTDIQSQINILKVSTNKVNKTKKSISDFFKEDYMKSKSYNK